MSPPPIRYPLPTLVLLIVVGLVAWRGEAMTRPLRAALAERWRREVKGPEYPHSDRPQVVAGPITRKGLLLHDETAVSATPGAAQTGTIRVRMFVDVFDVWPLEGEPTSYRVGNREPIGWVAARDLLPWSTRLVVRAPEGASRPVLGWTADAIEVADWDPDQPWAKVAARRRVRLTDLPAESWGVWISREELLALIRRSLGASDGEITRLRAVLGRLLDDRPLTEADRAAARAALPAPVFARPSARPEDASERLARANEQWAPEASWGGLSFQFLPVSALP